MFVIIFQLKKTTLEKYFCSLSQAPRTRVGCNNNGNAPQTQGISQFPKKIWEMVFSTQFPRRLLEQLISFGFLTSNYRNEPFFAANEQSKYWGWRGGCRFGKIGFSRLGKLEQLSDWSQKKANDLRKLFVWVSYLETEIFFDPAANFPPLSETDRRRPRSVRYSFLMFREPSVRWSRNF